MTRIITLAATLLAAAPAVSQGAASAPAVPLADLAAAVDLPDPKARRAAAAELARRGTSPATWLPALRSFGSFECKEPGVMDATVALWTGKGTEDTELTVYVPRTYDPATPAPLMLVLHGAGGNGRHMYPMWREASEKLGMLVLSPTDRGANAGYAYTDPERTATLSAIRWARRHFNVDENRIFGSGVSRGAHLLWDLALRRPDLFAAIAPIIGSPRFAPAAQNNMRYLPGVADLPIRQLLGARDDPAMVGNVREAFAILRALGAQDAQLVEFPDKSHEFDFAAVDWLAFLGSVRRDPLRARVVRATARPGEGRAAWLEVLATANTVQESFVQRVKESEWKTMDEAAKRRSYAAEMEKRTARLTVSRAAPGKFVAEGSGVQRFRLLLAEGDFDPGKPVEVSFGGKTISRRVTPSSSALLAEFVERFDRTFLPVAEMTVP